jgi:hypothetical protein
MGTGQLPAPVGFGGFRFGPGRHEKMYLADGYPGYPPMMDFSGFMMPQEYANA